MSHFQQKIIKYIKTQKKKINKTIPEKKSNGKYFRQRL